MVRLEGKSRTYLEIMVSQCCSVNYIVLKNKVGDLLKKQAGCVWRVSGDRGAAGGLGGQRLTRLLYEERLAA